MDNISDAMKIIGRSPMVWAELSIDKDPEPLAMVKNSSVNVRLEDADYDGHSLSMLC
jgi:hypothetical protein